MPYENIDVIAVAVAAGVAVAVAALSLFKKLLTPAATAVAAVILVAATVFTGYAGLTLYAGAFLLSGILSFVGRKRRAEREAGIHKRTGTRGVVQVICNGLPALVFAAVWFSTGIQSFYTAFVASLAAGFADSAASDIGILSRRTARSILTFRPVKRGLSGGVTPLGTLSAFLGAIFVAALALPFGNGYGIVSFAVAFAAAFAATLADSVLGASLQALYRCNECGELTEKEIHCGAPTTLIRGARVMDNDLVNFISLIFAGALAAAVVL